jgi:restriction system protein
MSPRRRHSEFDGLAEILRSAPVWFGPLVAAAVFVVFHFVLPAFLHSKINAVDIGPILQPFALLASWLLTGAVLFIWVGAELWKLTNRRMLDRQTGLASIAGISWDQFERLVSEAYRRKGYLADVIASPSGDGGVDIRLTGHGETVLVQCKQWKTRRVGVSVVRELLGVVVHQQAHRGIVVTSGGFTDDARAFARQSAQIELVDGPILAQLIAGVQAGASVNRPAAPVPITRLRAPRCPRCGAEMVLRTARKGRNAGSQFWGCPNYSAGCKGIRQLEPVG